MKIKRLKDNWSWAVGTVFPLYVFYFIIEALALSPF
jgi:hypothetical protein